MTTLLMLLANAFAFIYSCDVLRTSGELTATSVTVTCALLVNTLYWLFKESEK